MSTLRRLVERGRDIWFAGIALTALLHMAPVAVGAIVPDPLPPCQATTAGGAIFITETCVDPVLNQPFVDVRRQASLTDASTGITVNFLYVHGGFTGTNARFSFYFPSADQYKGRFFETTYPTLSTEDAAPGCTQIGTSECSVTFALTHGAYVVSTNNAGGVPAGGALAAYRANAAAAKYSRIIAHEIYPGSPRPRGYLYGASGGGYQTVGSMENSSGVWDGAVPMVFGAPNAIPNFYAASTMARRILGEKAAQVADAVAPGGGDPYAGLSDVQRAALLEASRMGLPLRAWWQYQSITGASLAGLGRIVRAADPTYVDDFWTLPTYEGREAGVRAARIQLDTSVASVTSDHGLVLAQSPPSGALNADLVVTSGPQAGQTFPIIAMNDNTVHLPPNSGITAGVRVRIDNSWLIALQYFPRHQVPADHETGWDQYVGPDGTPLYPQRRMVIGPTLNASTSGSVSNGRFHGKMIMAESAMDGSAFPWSGDWYRRQAQAAQGANLNDNFRLWYMDHADHAPDLSSMEAGVGFAGFEGAVDHIVGYIGEVQQALLDLDAWVVRGTPPPQTTNYTLDGDTQLHLAPTAHERRGIQPVVDLAVRTAANGASAERVEAAVGQPVLYAMQAQTPPGAGKIVRVEWDFESAGRFAPHASETRVSRNVSVAASHTFERPGTYFSVVRVTAQRDGDTHAKFGLVQNLATVRVVVH